MVVDGSGTLVVVLMGIVVVLVVVLLVVVVVLVEVVVVDVELEVCVVAVSFGTVVVVLEGTKSEVDTTTEGREPCSVETGV